MLPRTPSPASVNAFASCGGSSPAQETTYEMCGFSHRLTGDKQTITAALRLLTNWRDSVVSDSVSAEMIRASI